MTLAEADRDRIVDEIGREPTPTEAALFENLWSEHCAYRSSAPLLTAFDTEGERVVVGPGDDAGVVALDEDTCLAVGIESHNHPSYVDPYDGAATGVGGIVRDVMSMGAYPIALTDSLYFGGFERDHSKYLFEGVVEGISDYGNAIGVPTVSGSVAFHPGYEGNPLVNVACVGVVSPERMVTGAASQPHNELVIVGNATGRDGLGGASFASEDLEEDAETEDRPAVQVGDPYTEKLLIEANERLLDEDLIESARDLGAAGLGGATSEQVAQGGFGATIDLGHLHLREPNMNPMEILLAESQERMCYEVRPENVERVKAVADRYDLGCSVIGEVTTGNYVCRYGGERVVDVPAEFLGEGAPTHDRSAREPPEPDIDHPVAPLDESVETVLAHPNTASKRWVYRQYDHEVGVRTAVPPGDDAAVLAIREADRGLALSAGAAPNWTSCAPYDGARAVALENATNLATVGAEPIAVVDCLNGGNPEKPEVFGGFERTVEGLADMCASLGVPVVGGNVSLYNDSAAGPIPPTPTVTMLGETPTVDPPPAAASPEGTLLLVGDDASGGRLGGSTYVAAYDGNGRFPRPPHNPLAIVDALADVATQDGTVATHDVSHGGLAVALAELVTPEAGLDVTVESGDIAATLFSERPGRALVQTTDPDAVRRAFEGVAPVVELGRGTADGRLDLDTGPGTLTYEAAEIASMRGVIADELD